MNCNWLHYLELRTAHGAQKEHKDIAESIRSIFVQNLPEISKLSTTRIYGCGIYVSSPLSKGSNQTITDGLYVNREIERRRKLDSMSHKNSP